MTTITRDHDREEWQRLGGNEACEACGHKGFCMRKSAAIMCMRPQEVKRPALSTHVNAAGYPYAIFSREGSIACKPIPFRRREERPNWTAAEQSRCTALYNDLLANLTIPAPAAALAADARRFGEYAEAIAAVEDAAYFQPPHEMLGWLMEHGHWQDAIAAGAIYEGKLAGALIDSKVYVYRERGQIRNLKGRKLNPAAKVKALSLHGTREERGCPHVLYQHDQLALATGKLLVIAGGPAKVDALIVAGFHAAGGEESLSDAQIAAIAAANPAGIVIVADAENAKTPGDLSPGQRNALTMAERLEALGGQAVKIAEPAREADSGKVDADNLLRDHGPEALRALVREAVPLAAYRQRLGLAPADCADQQRLIAELRSSLHLAREERDHAKEWNRLTFAALRAGGGTTPLMKKVGRAGLGLVSEWATRRDLGHAQVDPKTAERWVEIDLTAAGENVGLGDDAAGATLTYLCNAGLARKRTKWLTIDNPAPGQYPRRKQLLVHFPQGSKEAAVAAIAALRPETSATARPWGGQRPRCDQHPEAGTKTTTTSVTTCAECGEVLDSPPPRVEWHDAAGDRTDPPGDSADLHPQDAGYKLTSTEESLDAPPELPVDLHPQVAVLPPPPVARRPSGPAPWAGTHPCSSCGGTAYARAGEIPRCLPCARERPAEPWEPPTEYDGDDVAAGGG